MTSRGDQLVEEYLRRFDNAAVFLPEARRAELRQEIVEHIEVGTEEAQAVHAEAVRTVLDRLGPPADIVASETDSGSFPEVAPAAVNSPSDDGQTQDFAKGAVQGGSSMPAAVPDRPRRFTPPLIGAVVTAVVVGVLAFAAFGVSSESNEPVQGPIPAPAESSEPGGEQPDRTPESGAETSRPPSPSESNGVEGTPSEDAGTPSESSSFR